MYCSNDEPIAYTNRIYIHSNSCLRRLHDFYIKQLWAHNCEIDAVWLSPHYFLGIRHETSSPYALVN